METNNYTYANGIYPNLKQGQTPQPNCFNRAIIRTDDGRWFYSKTNTLVARDYAEEKDCYEIVMINGKEYAANICNGFVYGIWNI